MLSTKLASGLGALSGVRATLVSKNASVTKGAVRSLTLGRQNHPGCSARRKVPTSAYGVSRGNSSTSEASGIHSSATGSHNAQAAMTYRNAYGKDLYDYYSKCSLPDMHSQIVTMLELKRRVALEALEADNDRLRRKGPSFRAGDVVLSTEDEKETKESDVSSKKADTDNKRTTRKKRKKSPKKVAESIEGAVEDDGLPSFQTLRRELFAYAKDLIPRLSRRTSSKQRVQYAMVVKVDLMQQSNPTGDDLFLAMQRLAASALWAPSIDLFWKGQGLNDMPEDGYVLAIHACHKLDKGDQAIAIYNLLRRDHPPLTRPKYSYLLKSAIKQRSILAEKVFLDMTDAGFAPATVVARQVLKLVGNADVSTDKTIRVLERLGKYGVAPDKTGIALSFKAFAKDCSKNAGRILKLWDEVVNSYGLTPKPFWYGTALRACRFKRDIHRTREILRRAEEDDMASAAVYTAAVSALTGCGQHLEALSVYQSMRDRGIRPNELLITTMFKLIPRTAAKARSHLLGYLVNEVIANDLPFSTRVMYGIVGAYSSEKAAAGATSQQFTRRVLAAVSMMGCLRLV
mgnify:FL=1